jgi:hypothetical protein
MITYHLVDDFLHPSAGRTTVHSELEPGQTCRDFVPREWADEAVQAVINGAAVPLDSRLMEGDDLVLYMVPEWSAVFQIAVSMLVSWLMVPDIPSSNPDGPGRRTYGFSGLGNRWGHSTTVPVLFGSMRAGGHVVGFYSENLGLSAGQQMYMMLALSEGPVHEIAKRTVNAPVPISPALGAVYLDENDASRYAGLEITVSTGNINGLQHAGFPGVFIQRTVGQEIGIRENWLAANYAAGAASCRVLDNSSFFNDDTVFLSYDNTTATGDPALVDVIDADGETIHFETPVTLGGHSANAKVVAYSPLVISGDGTTGEALRLNLHFPSGLYRMNSQGQATNWEVKIKVQVRPASGGAWVSLGQVDFTNNRIGGFWETASLTLNGTGYEGIDLDIELQKMTAGPASPDATYADQVILDSVVFNDAGIYLAPGTAIVGVHGVPTAQLNGRFPTVTTQVEGVVFEKPTNDAGTAWAATSAVAPSVDYRNPAWIVLEILRNKRWGLGNFVADEDIDFASFRSWATFCEEDTLSGYANSRLVEDRTAGDDFVRVPLGAAATFNVGDDLVVGYGTTGAETLTITNIVPGTAGNGLGVTPYDEDYDTLTFTPDALSSSHSYGEIVGVTEERCLCDFMFDEDTTIQEALSICASSGRAIIVKTGNQYRAVVDKARSAVQLIDEANIVKDSFSRTVLGKVDLPNTFDAVFFNRDKAFNRDSARVVDSEALAAGEAQKIDRVEMKGVTRIGQAYRDGAYLLRKRRLEKERVTFDIGLDGLAAEAGDRVDIAHYAMNNGRGTRIIDAQVFSGRTQVKLDDEVDYSSHPGQWIIRIADPSDDSIITAYMNGGGSRGQWITLDRDIGSAMIGFHAAYGPVGKTTTPVVIQEIGRTEGFQRRVIAVLYNEAIYDDVAPEPTPNEGEGWDSEETGDKDPVGETRWDSWASNTGGNSVYGSGDSALKATAHTGLNPDGSPWQKVLLDWNEPTLRPPVGQDVYRETFRTAGTWNASTRTLDGDGVLSDYATEGGGRQWAGSMIRGYEVFIRHAQGSSNANAWSWVATTEQAGTLIQYPFERGATYEFAVCPVTMRGWKLPLPKCPVVSVVIPDGMAETRLRKIAPEPPTAIYQNLPHLQPMAHLEFGSTDAGSVEGVAESFEARLGGWIAGRTVRVERGGELSLAMLVPDAAESVFVRTLTKAGVWSDTALEIVTDYAGPSTLYGDVSQKENADMNFAGVKDGFTINGDGYLEDTGGGLVLTYETDWIDGGATVAGERRVVWAAIDSEVSDGTLWADATMTFAEVGQTFEGNLYEVEPFILRTYVAVDAAGGSAKKTWVECRGPVEATDRYHAVKVEVTRATSAHTVLIKEIQSESWTTENPSP